MIHVPMRIRALGPLLLSTVLATAFATAPAHAAGSQQQRMKTCNAEAKGKKGDERRAFMSQCLRGSGEGNAKAGKEGRGSKGSKALEYSSS